jgi:cysteine-rich repeat protein
MNGVFMNRFGFLIGILCVLALPSAGCSSSHGTSNGDAGITIMIDASVPDGSIPPASVCGNGRLEASETCDDGNTTAGDGCDATCRREAYCGDGTTNAGEVCDDGNNRSNDGCRSDCRSNETCGNEVIDYARGEVCDGGDLCSEDCLSIMGCGDETLTAPEECDDGGVMRWDGCGADCRNEISLAVQMLQIASASGAGTPVGCDYSGDGTPDKQFSEALGPLTTILNTFISGGGGGGTPTFLLSFMGLDDPTGSADDSLRVAWLGGAPGETAGTYVVDVGSLEDDGSPRTSLQGSIAAHALEAGPEELDLPLGILPLTLEQARLKGTTVASGGELSALNNGVLCGGVGPALLGFVTADQLEMLGSGAGFPVEIGPACVGTDEPTLFEMMVAGAQIAVFRIGGVSPDVDLDGDGLERFEVTSTGEDGCQPVITACIDGDGTRIEGRDCVHEVLTPGVSRFVDGYSTALTFTATRAQLVGTNATPAPMPDPGPEPTPAPAP